MEEEDGEGGNKGYSSIPDMSSFDFQMRLSDAPVIHDIKNKKTENMNDIINELGLDEMEKLNTLMTEKGKYIMTDQSIRQYVAMLKECREIEVCLHTEYRGVKKRVLRVSILGY